MTLEQRFARLERRNRWLTTALALVLVALGGVVLVAWKQDKPKVMEEVRAKKFVLVDDAGKMVGVLYRDSETTGLELYGVPGRGQSIVKLSASGENVARYVLSSGTGSAVFGTAGKDSGHVSVTRAAFAGSSTVGLTDSPGCTGIQVGQRGEGFIRIGAFRGIHSSTSSPGEEPERKFTPNEDPAPRVLVMDKDMKPLFKAPKE